MKTVYFIKPVGMDGPIKIGCSISPDGRRKSLQFWSPFPLEIIAEIDGDMRLERRFHARFQHLFQGREWFRVAPELLDAIERINAGTFDIGGLPPPKVLHNTERGERRTWTEEQRKRASWTHRCQHMYNRSGFYCPWGERRSPDEATVAAAVERYLAAPHIHGRPGANPASIERQKAWLASLETRKAAA